MRRLSPMFVAVATILSPLSLGALQAADVPDYMRPIAGLTTSSPGETATKNVLALNTSMFELYGNAGAVFRKNILAQHPVILGLFSGAGGRFILYRPGMAPLEASQVPMSYQLLKSVGHSTMALAEVVGPYLDNAANQSWRGPLLAFRSRMAALEGLDATDMPVEWRDNSRTILQNNLKFMDDSVAEGVLSLASLQSFAKKQAPKLPRTSPGRRRRRFTIGCGARRVEVDARHGLGEDLRRQQHHLRRAPEQRAVQRAGAVLPADAINHRLMMIETVSFTTTPDDMLNSLTRIIVRPLVGALFFGNYHLMDYELMGGDARDAIIAEDEPSSASRRSCRRWCRLARTNGRR